MSPNSLPIGAGGSREPSKPRPVGFCDGGMPNNLWDWTSSSIFSIWARLLRPEQENDEMPERTHPDRLKISIRTTKGDSMEANGNDIGGEEGRVSVSNSNTRQKKYKT